MHGAWGMGHGPEWSARIHLQQGWNAGPESSDLDHRLWDSVPPEPGFRELTLSRMDFWGPGETGEEGQGGTREMSRPVGRERRRPEGTRAIMRAVRAIVSLLGNPLGEARRKMSKGTGLGLGQPRTKG